MNTISRFNSLDEVGGQDQAGQRGQPLSRRLGARSLVLVGLMGAGKSTVGRRLAQTLAIAVPRCRSRDRGRSRHDDPRNLRHPRRGPFSRRRAPGDRPPAAGRADRARHRRRRLHERRDPRCASPSTASRSGSRPISTCSCAGCASGPPARCCRIPIRKAPCAASWKSAIRSMPPADITVDSHEAPHDRVVADIVKALGEWLGKDNEGNAAP